MLKTELSKFLVVGLSTVAIDFLAYMTFLFLGVNTSNSKALSFLMGTVFAFFANKSWTFGNKSNSLKSAVPFLILYSISMTLNTKINSVMLYLMDESLLSLSIAFIVATGFSAIFNFVGMKFFVFKKEEKYV
ncbi:putative membrane protein with GtrA-like domain [Vibrio nigripulchritudo MADA3029]|nr:putative membrane protein with GtrA-like domain [Vibrio nigripulchritudo MADA3020]CCN56530.1 putative membrane protein with GtrA-like domain [Vibrio nigripulchritudo MADA3021]CCN58847.1 putative membrane protein with GtrA-like domain [Vibrio nigripulchritudo MADA3029]